MNATEQPLKTWSNLLGYWFACPITGAACGPFKDRAAMNTAIEAKTGPKEDR